MRKDRTRILHPSPHLAKFLSFVGGRSIGLSERSDSSARIAGTSAAALFC